MRGAPVLPGSEGVAVYRFLVLKYMEMCGTRPEVKGRVPEGMDAAGVFGRSCCWEQQECSVWVGFNVASDYRLYCAKVGHCMVRYCGLCGIGGCRQPTSVNRVQAYQCL